ncbi:MAG: hypothetical protein ABIH83_01475 [Candidatus Micrarchaeota archaeon]
MPSAMVVDLSPVSPVYTFAINIVIISIVISALVLGISRAVGSRKLWGWGVEELAQSIINAALLGAIVGGAALLSSATSELSSEDIILKCPGPSNIENSPLAYSLCVLEDSINKSGEVSSSLNKQSFSLSSLASVQINANVISSSPFSALQYSSSTYSSWSGQISSLSSLLEVQKQSLYFIAYTAFSLFLPIGLLLRLFFATRKLGGAIMAGAIGFFIIYPLAFFAFASHDTALTSSYNSVSEDLASLSSTLSIVPAIDWDKPGIFANIIANISSTKGESLASQTSLPYKSVSAFLGSLQMYAFIYPLVSLAITLVAVRELALLLGGEFRLDLFEMV